MYILSAERYKNAKVDFLRVRKTDEIWVSMKNVHDGLGVNNMSGLVLKEIYGKYEKKTLQTMNVRNTKRQREKFLKRMII